MKFHVLCSEMRRDVEGSYSRWQKAASLLGIILTADARISVGSKTD